MVLHSLSKANLINFLVGAGHLALFGVVFLVPHPAIRAGALGLIAVMSLCAWLLAHKRFRLIHDTPTARISSAHQGYVELVGKCDLHPGMLPLGPLSGPPCVWYRYVVKERSGDRWEVLNRKVSEDTFLLTDGSGRCVVDPDYAEVQTARRRKWRSGDYHYDLEYLAPGDPVYALGEFASIGGAHADLNKSQDVAAMLRDWKRNPEHMLERFDSDKDGNVDPKEWEQARKAAEKVVEQRHLEMRLEPDIHILRAPRDGRPFLLSNRDPERFASRYRMWAWLHVGVFAAAAVVALTLLAPPLR